MTALSIVLEGTNDDDGRIMNHNLNNISTANSTGVSDNVING